MGGRSTSEGNLFALEGENVNGGLPFKMLKILKCLAAKNFEKRKEKK